MPEEIDYERRRIVFRRLPLIAGALVLAPSLLIPDKAEAYDIRYSKYSVPGNASLEKLLSTIDYPGEFELCYEIPENGDKNGDSLQGDFRLTRNPDETRLSIKIIHPRESKIVTLSERRDLDSSGMIFYSESDFDTLRGKFMYNNHHAFWYADKPQTAIGLVEDLINGKIPNPEQPFVFQGNGQYLREYRLKVKTKDEEGFDLVREAEVKGDSPRINSLKVFYRSINGVQIPVEIHVNYKVKALDLPILGPIYVTPTLIGVLSV